MRHILLDIKAKKNSRFNEIAGLKFRLQALENCFISLFL
jgi:hypothetical protein